VLKGTFVYGEHGGSLGQPTQSAKAQGLSAAADCEWPSSITTPKTTTNHPTIVIANAQIRIASCMLVWLFLIGNGKDPRETNA